MDIVRYIRRVRLHGYALHLIAGKDVRANAATLANSRPLREDKNAAIKRKWLTKAIHMKDPNVRENPDKWYAIENLQEADRFLICLFKMHSKAFYDYYRQSKKKKEMVEDKLKWFMTSAFKEKSPAKLIDPTSTGDRVQ